MISRARASASGSAGNSPVSGLVRASHVAIAPYSVSTEPSSRTSVGTLPFGLIAWNAGSCVAPPATSIFSAA